MNFFTMTEIIKPAYAAMFNARTNQDLFVPGDGLTIFGKGFPNDTLTVKFHDPSDRVIRIDFIRTDAQGFFSSQIFTWPQPSKTFVFGLYNLEINSNIGSPNTQFIPVAFAELQPSGQQSLTPASGQQHLLAVKLDSPTQVSTNSTFRIFVQVTFDGALVDADASQLLGSSHIHLGNQTILLTNKFGKLHEGLYFADVMLSKDGTYIVHAVAFYKGFRSDDSKVVTTSSSSISTIQQSVNELNTRLNATNRGLEQTRAALNDTRASITSSVSVAANSISNDIQSAKDAVKNMQDASGQLNSLLLPILVLISVIIALQISLFARIRASYR